jgi:CO dehydrogenase nickel-insertion accessory protein CooC1
MLIVNRAKEGQEGAVEEAVEEFGLDLVGMVPEDTAVRDFDLKGKPTIELSNRSKAVKDAYTIFEKVMPS